MNPKYVCDLKHSYELFAVGWSKETKLWWIYSKRKYKWELRSKTLDMVNRPERWSIFSAPLTDELLEELPAGTMLQKHKGMIEVGLGILLTPGIYDESLPNALADLWCWWKEREEGTKKETWNAFVEQR
ncbi:MAG: hypothetical protein Q8J68_14615 [Methanolobus sp.]|uniref:hypothetical protein n=1 Tax=Methanolobus sp. TaxID=1874737 RepID=UPI00273225D9|nr:hypothetical protein [Methanolobus sp.]MDP2218507.1 hypothetical protein [Methanolobus sp.]